MQGRDHDCTDPLAKTPLARAVGGRLAVVGAAAAALEEVVVTVRRVEETAQSVPVAVTAITGQALSDARIDNGAALQKLAPSLSVYSLSRDEETFSLRGLGSAWTTAHLNDERAMADLLGIPADRYTQVGLFPVAYTLGTDFKAAWRRPAAEVVSWNRFGERG